MTVRSHTQFSRIFYIQIRCLISLMLLNLVYSSHANPVTNAYDNADLSAYAPLPNQGWGNVNGGFGFGLWSAVGGISGGGYWMEDGAWNNRQLDGNFSFGLWAGHNPLSGFAIARPLANNVTNGTFEVSTRFHLSGLGDNLVNLRVGNSAASFSDGELLAFGLGVSTNSQIVLAYRDAAGTHLLPSGEARGALSGSPSGLAAATNIFWRWSVAFDTTLGLFQLSVTNPAFSGGFSTSVSGSLKLAGGSVGSFAIINSSTGDNMDLLFDAPMFTQQPLNLGSVVLEPQNKSVFANLNVVFQYAVNQPASYQWFFGNNPIPAATNSSLVLSAVTGTNAGIYWAVATNFSGSVTSRLATLTVYDLSTASGVWVGITNSTATGIAPELGIFSLSPSPANNNLPIAKTPNSSIYYNLQRSESLAGDFQPSILSLGTVPPIWNVFPLTPYRALGFYRVQVLSAFDSLDSDGDRIDDVWELEYGLNPLFAGDANNISTFRDANNNLLTWLQAYRQLFGRDIPDKEVYGREYSVFNFGLPTAHYEAISREISLYNGESPPLTTIQEVYSREVSSFNFGEPFGSADALSREYSVFNFGEPSAPYEANSREVSVYNGEAPPLTDIQEVYSREVSVFRNDLPTANYEAISREVSVFNNNLN